MKLLGVQMRTFATLCTQQNPVPLPLRYVTAMNMFCFNKKDEDVLDTWFSSSLLPLSNFGWPQHQVRIMNAYLHRFLRKVRSYKRSIFMSCERFNWFFFFDLFV